MKCPMYGCRIATILAVIALLVLGCSDDSPLWSPAPPSSAVQEFIASQGLPMLQFKHQIAASNRVEFFRVDYGEGHDCPSGCIYSTAFGVRVDDEVGWFAFDDMEGYEAERGSYYPLLSSEVFLFRFDTWLLYLNEEESTCWRYFLPYLAGDPDTSSDALTTLSGLLYTNYSPYVAVNLINNSSVRGDIEILSILAGLPYEGNSTYDNVRATAQTLLDGLGG